MIGKSWWKERTGPLRCAQPQNTKAWPTSPGAAHLPASPPVRSPARWGSMAGSPLLRGPRAGGVGLLVLLLLGMLRPPPGLCARLVKVRTRVGHRVGGRGRMLLQPPWLQLPGRAETAAAVARDPAASPCPGHTIAPRDGLGLCVGGWRCPGLHQQPRPAHSTVPGAGGAVHETRMY